ncbi:molybdenum ABC transporter ATP-binding protein [Sulfuriroseicoccus oceanibius]|uniref:Molybdenum ABC transporter ATP-binding protein n=1 Tax=Sulfuriroseicoccus oceanibius TaxID=2707525 RepID=A0A6B3L9Y5_9BACT|nr:molybdenum ABC transporter ATP-binding protein [Sulfuriroseicoccus oceanibius]QQL45554.1 molybdenum ABC transporter ATP-binding protein [Sulfuriroseicoccus oceanibius]
MSIELKLELERGAFSLDVELQIPQRGVTGLIGPSGSGKTTILRALAGLDRHRGAVVRIGNEVWQQGRGFVQTHRRRLGYVFQEPGLFSHLSVRGNVEYGAKRVAEGERKLAFDEAVAMLGVEPLLERNVGELSGGERQRVAVARALASSPRLLLLDEPLSALDDDAKRGILPWLQKLHRECGVPMVYVTHSVPEIAAMADHLVILESGRVVESGAASALLVRSDLTLAHHGEAAVVMEATVSAHDAAYGLSRLKSPAGDVTVVGTELAVGQRVRVRIAARDVSITRERQEGTSILNRFDAVVRELAADGDAQVLVRLETDGGAALLARITKFSADALGLAIGQRVVAQAKSVSLLVG